MQYIEKMSTSRRQDPEKDMKARERRQARKDKRSSRYAS